MSNPEYCKQAVDVHAISDSMSEAVDLVIVLWTCTSHIGFIGLASLVNVDTTRGRYGEIHVMDSSVLGASMRHDLKISRLCRLYSECAKGSAVTRGSEV